MQSELGINPVDCPDCECGTGPCVVSFAIATQGSYYEDDNITVITPECNGVPGSGSAVSWFPKQTNKSVINEMRIPVRQGRTVVVMGDYIIAGECSAQAECV